MKTIIKSSLHVLPALMLMSCADSSLDSKSGGAEAVNQNEVIAVDGSNVQGNYAAEIWPVNHNLHFKTIGTVGVARDGDTFTATVNLKYGPKDTVVKGAVYTARRCPNLNDDINKDAYIDILEARLAVGKIVIPFDGDLDSQMGGRSEYPMANSSGKLFYSKTASFSRMFEDLKSADEDSSDQYIKLKEDEGITFPGRIVLFQGMSKKITLPETVKTTDGDSRHESLPIGCAVLWKVENLPAELTADSSGTTVTP